MMKKQFQFFVLLLMSAFAFSLTSCDDEKEDIVVATSVVGTWIEDVEDINVGEVCYLEIKSDGTFYGYAAQDGVIGSKGFTGTWSYNAPNLTLVYSSTKKHTVEVKHNKFSVNEIHYKKME